MPFRFFILVLLLISCATENTVVATKKESPPFLKRYKKKNKELIYIAINDKGNVDNPTMKMIQETVKKFDPEIIITEYPVEGEYRPVPWTCDVAKPRGIPCLSGEPFQTDILKRARTKRVNNDDILFFYTFRSLVTTMKGKKSPLDGLSGIIEQEKKTLNIVSQLDEEEFVRMYRDKMNSKTVRVGKPEIRPKADGHYIQRLAKIVQDSHEELILERIQKEQLGHERVMVVYGVEHYERHLNPLEDFFSGHLP